MKWPVVWVQSDNWCHRVMSKDTFKDRGFSEQKLALLASLLEKEGVQQAPRLKRIPRDGELPLSSAQMRLWLFDQLEPASAAYNVAIRHDFNGHFDLVAFERSLSEIVRRHEVLRTCYLKIDGHPVQKIVRPELFRIPVIDLQDLPEVDREPEVASLASADARQPFDLGKAPLVRAHLLKLAPDEHVLLLNFHHIAFDWWSYGVFEHELAALYDAFLRGEKASPLPELPLQYVDFAAWQRQWLQGEILQEQLDYWRKKLSGSLPVLDLPTDRPRPAIQTYNGSLFTSVLPNKLTEALKILNQREGVTMFATLLGAFSVLLQRYTRQDDILVGAPTAGRNRAEVEGLLGFFVNTLVMRTDLSGDPTFRQFLRRVKETTFGAYAHQDLPFEKLVEVLNPERDAGHSPMFQVMLSMLDTPKQAVRLRNLRHERKFIDNGKSKFDLTLSVIEEPQGMTFLCEYNTDLFNRDRIERMLGHLQVLLEGVVADPDQHLSELPLLTAEERHRLLIEWNDTKVAYPEDGLIHGLFEAQVERAPGAVAVEYEGVRLTYGELNQQADQVAHHLQSLGVGPDVVVGLFVERSLEMVVGLLGILKAGGAYVPLDPSFPRARLAYMIADSDMKVLVTHRQLDRSLTVRPPSIVYLDADWEAISGQHTTKAKSSSPRPENFAYVLYTSGSTGKPKGVAIPHAAVVNFLHSMQREPGFTAKDKLLAVTTLSFDIAGLEIHLPLVTGGTTMIASREDVYDPARLMRRIRESQCTVMQATPATWRALIDAGWEGSKNLKLLCGGEALPADLVHALLPRCAQLWNMYGPTETTIWSTIHRVTSARGPVPIGRPIANTQVFMLDEHRQLVPAGIVGELYIGGLGLARGYFARPELTAERFVESPFDPDVRLYRTGDQARWLPDGTLECLGRADNQVKIRGFRIELGEIESVLRSHPAVREAVVVMREEREKQLIAYVVLMGESSCTAGELRDYLKQKLPPYMVPADYVVLDSIPVTPNGKVDRLALRAPEPSAFLEDASYVPPRDAYESLICEAWVDVLGLKRVGIRDNFFDLGGHSLLAVKLMQRLQKIIPGEPLPLRAVLEAPTVEEFAAWLRDHKAGERQFLVRVRPGSSMRPPFFCVYGAGGSVLEVQALAMALPADLPFYCFEDKGLDGSTPFESIEEAARCYIDEIRQVQPHGPYRLGGHCYGGLVAFETARMLEELGEPVAALVLIDTFNPAFLRSLPERWRLFNNGRFYIRRTAWHLRRMFAGSPGEWLRYISWRLRPLRDQNLKRRVHANLSARNKFVPKTYRGRALIFRGSDLYLREDDDYYLGWQSVLRGGIECFEIGEVHASILQEPAVQLVAEKLDAKLKELAIETKEV
jgi:amino acid adenylation domain-containing protein